MAETTQTRPSGKLRQRSGSNRPVALRFHLYAVTGTLRGERRTLHVVCCHAADARAMVSARQPEIDKLRVTRGKPVDFIAVGDHALID